MINNIIKKCSEFKARHNKNGILINTIWNLIDIKLVDSAIFLLNWTKLSYYRNSFNWLMPLVDLVKLINSPLNLVLLYFKSVNQLKI